MQDELGGEKKGSFGVQQGTEEAQTAGSMIALCVDILKKDSATLSGESCDYTFSVI